MFQGTKRENLLINKPFKYAGSGEFDKVILRVSTSEILYFSLELLKQRLAVQDSSKGQ
jgi:hypothetical protein